MPLEDDLKAISGRIADLRDRISTEEATKQSLVLPFLQALGYNVFDPTEIEPEFTADIGIKQGEKVDYAVMADGEPVILNECKRVSDSLASDHRVSQLYRYFGATQVRIGVLTNGVTYRFFSDLESSNVMDTSPFLEVDLEHLDARSIEQLGRFAKGFDVEEVVEAASRLRYIHGMKQALMQQYSQPEEDFVDWLGRKVYNGRMTQAAREMLSNLTRRAFHEFVNDRISDTLQAAQNLARFQEDEIEPEQVHSSEEEVVEREPKSLQRPRNYKRSISSRTLQKTLRTLKEYICAILNLTAPFSWTTVIEDHCVDFISTAAVCSSGSSTELDMTMVRWLKTDSQSTL